MILTATLLRGDLKTAGALLKLDSFRGEGGRRGAFVCLDVSVGGRRGLGWIGEVAFAVTMDGVVLD